MADEKESVYLLKRYGEAVADMIKAIAGCDCLIILALVMLAGVSLRPIEIRARNG